LKREHLDGLIRLLHSQLFSKVAQQLINAMPTYSFSLLIDASRSLASLSKLWLVYLQLSKRFFFFSTAIFFLKKSLAPLNCNLKILGRLYDIAAHLTQEQRPTILDTLNRAVARTLVIVTDTHKHVDRVLYTYMTSYGHTFPKSYLAQGNRLSILIDKQALFINSWLIKLSVDNFLLINTGYQFLLISQSHYQQESLSRVDPSDLAFSLSSHRHSCIVFYVTLTISLNKKQR
jgi:hypothetical protein